MKAANNFYFNIFWYVSLPKFMYALQKKKWSDVESEKHLLLAAST